LGHVSGAPPAITSFVLDYWRFYYLIFIRSYIGGSLERARCRLAAVIIRFALKTSDKLFDIRIVYYQPWIVYYPDSHRICY